MPVDRSVTLSITQLCDFVEVDPKRFVGLEVDKRANQITVCLEPKDEPLPVPFNRVEFADALLSMRGKES